MTEKRICVAAAGLLLAVAGCDKPKAPEWQRISAGETEPAFHLDVANISRRAGTPYLVMQTRYSDGRYGVIRASANCTGKKLEPTALSEEVFAANGQGLETKMTTMPHEDEQAVLKIACTGS